MKIKLTSLVLSIAMLLSLFTVYSFATETDTVSEDEVYASSHLFYKLSFGDEDDDFGTMPGLVNSENSSMSTEIEANGNRYARYNINDASNNVYFQFSPSIDYSISADKLGYMILEMDFNDLGNLLNTSKFFEIHSGTGSLSSTQRIAASDVINISNDGTNNFIYFNSDKSNKIQITKGEWVHIRCEFSILSSNATKYGFKCYVGDEYFETTFKLGNPKMISHIRIGSTKTTNQIFGLDNVALYSGAKNFSSYKELTNVHGSLMMKVGAENASVNGQKVILDNSPILINNKIYCPVDVLESFTNKEPQKDYVVTLDGVEYIHIDNVSKAFDIDVQTYDMGLILVGDREYFLRTDASYTEIMNLMKTFIFDIPTPDSIKELVKTHTNNFDHPYILANSDKFSELREIYEAGKSGSLKDAEEKLLYEYINDYINSAASYLSTYCGITPTGTYNGIKSDKIPVNPNYSKYTNNGYDNGGRVTVPTTPLLYFAFAYQMTGHLNYARAAYDYSLALGEWNHWGPSHFLNCADTAAPVAISYDWLYDAYEELNSKGEISKFSGKVYDRTEISTILFTHVIVPGYIQSNNLNCPWPGSVESRYATKTSNWNAVCVSGVVAAALVILEDDIDVSGMTFATQKKISSSVFLDTETPIESIGNTTIHIGLDTYSDYAAKLTSMNLGTLARYGLEQYAPDGSYVESPSYWSYGTNTFFRLIASLLSATGDDFGFMDAWGIDTTCYFAIHSESSDYKTWNFNDGSVSQQDSSFFFFVGNYYGDDELVKVRKKHLSSGKKYSIYDILFYNTAVTGEPELQKDYYMVGIDAFSVRSSWDKGAIFAGIIGGPNTVSHGQMDAGSFIYHNKGKIWFHDIGADNYNMAGGYFSNFKLYRVGAEGHNIISITSEQSSLPYGQLTNANPKIIKTESSVDGGYAVLDMSDSYGSHVAKANRGILFTDSRSKVVIQDEYIFNGAKTAYWFGHYNIAPGYVDDVLISADGRTAFMISEDDIIRVSIVSDNENLKFEIMDCYTYVLDITKRTDRTTMGGASTETSRDSLRKLAIKCENVEALNLAVVIESVESYEIGTSYQFVSIDDWQINPKNTAGYEEKFKADFQPESVVIGSSSLNSPDGSYVLDSYEYNSKHYIGILPGGMNSEGKDSSYKILFDKNSGIDFSGNKYVSFDFDIFTEKEFINNTDIRAKVMMSDGTYGYAQLAKLQKNKICIGDSTTEISKYWKHVSVIISLENGYAYLFADDSYIGKIECLDSECTEILSIEFNFPASSSCVYTSSILLDNLNVRAFDSYYNSEELSKILSEGSSLKAWSDKIEYQSIYRPLAVSDQTYLYTNNEIENAIAEGKNIRLLRDTTGLINISGAVTVDTQGFRFDYVSDSYFPTVNGNSISFTSDSVTVRWHIDDDTVITEAYKGATIATFKDTSPSVGSVSYSLTEYAQGGIGYKFYTTGWSNVPGGKALTPDEMIVSEGNCDFWLVNNVPVNCMFATISNSGAIAIYNSEYKLREIISSSSDVKIILCSDVELLSTNSIPLAKNGKTLYLNGYTLSHKQYDIHTFTYQNNTTANFRFIGPGVLEGYTVRALFTSSSSTSDKTSPYGIYAENITILTDTQLADLRIGSHRFINCNIQQLDISGKSLFALWNKNQNVNGTVPVNLLKLTFEGCSIKCSQSSDASVFSYSANSYSEVYLKNTALVASGSLFDGTNAGLKLHISDGSGVSVNKLCADSSIRYSGILFDNGVMTNLSLDSKFIPSGSLLTSNYDAALPYRVSNNYVYVTWTDLSGNDLHSEYASIGVTPKITSNAVKDYLAKLGNAYTYELNEISQSGTVTLSPVLKSNVKIFQSMSIEEDLIMYFYIEKSEMDSKVNTVKVDNVRIMLSSYQLVEIEGVSYYMYRISSFTPSNACRKVEITVERLDGRTQTVSISAVGYLESLLSISENESEKILALKTLKYIQSAYAYFNSSNIAEYDKISAIIEEYKEYDLVFGGLKSEAAATGVMKDSIKSACFNLSASIRIRFIFNPSYTGEISVSFNGETGVYYVKDGKVAGVNYIEIVIPASLLDQSVVLSDGTNSISYGLGTYSYAMNNSNSKLQQMLVAMSEYSSAAKMYLNTIN